MHERVQSSEEFFVVPVKPAVIQSFPASAEVSRGLLDIIFY